MSNGSQLIVCRVTDCAHNKGKRCALPKIEVSFCDKDASMHQTKCLNYQRSQNL